MKDDLISRKGEKMDKLISLNEAIKLIDEFGYTNCKDSRDYEANSRMDKVRMKIQELPSAFDKEKVIEDLTDWKNDAEKWAAKYDEAGDIDNMELQDMAARCYVNAIEIVKNGGV